MTKKYIKDCTRRMIDEDIAIWKKGEKYLKEWYGIEINSKFERDGENVEVSYEQGEGNKAHEVIKEFLTDENFDMLCEHFVNYQIEKHETKAKMMVFLIIADEIDNYPEIASDYIKRRLMRIRTSTHEESYK